MPQFAVYRNSSSKDGRHIPYLLDVQSDLLEVIQTRVVVPLALPEVLAGKAAQRLMPVFEVEGRQVVMLTPELAGISKQLLGPPLTSLELERTRILQALDFLFLGW